MKLTNEQLIGRLKDFDQRETDLTAQVLIYLYEVENRKAYLELGYSSLFVFCQKVLNYSESSAYRRIASARTIGKYPEVLNLLTAKKVTITTLSMVAKIITPENCKEVMIAISGKSQREVEQYICQFRPVKKPREQVKPIVVEEEPKVVVQPAQRATSGAGSSAKTVVEPAGVSQQPGPQPTKQRYEYRFSLAKESQEQFEELQALLSGKYPLGAGVGDVFGEALQVLHAKLSPKRRAQRREARGTSECGTSSSRSMPQALKDQIWVRDNGQCTFVGSAGKQCSSTHQLEFHHKIPFAVCKEHTADNITLHCKSHNQYEGQQAFGAWYMNRSTNSKKFSSRSCGYVNSSRSSV